MKKAITLILITFLFCDGFSQRLSSFDFSKLKSFFIYEINDKSEKQFKTIDKTIAAKIIDIKEDDEFYVDCYAKYLIPIDKNYLAILSISHPQGGATFSTLFVFISNDYEIKKSEYICSTSIDIDGGFGCGLKMINDSIIEIYVNDFKYDDNWDKIIIDYNYLYYIINSQGFEKVIINNPSNDRLYPGISTRILSYDELKVMNKCDLNIIRNEIFADHGYIFKTKKWQEYFADKVWYKPRYEDVNDKLSVIEKINIENILKVAPL